MVMDYAEHQSKEDPGYKALIREVFQAHQSFMGLNWDRDIWMVPGRAYPKEALPFPEFLRELSPDKLHYLQKTLGAKRNRCALVNVHTGDILIVASNFEEMLEKVRRYKPPSKGLFA